MSVKHEVAIFSGTSRAILLVLSLGAGCGLRDSLPAEDSSRLTIRLTSPAFADGGMIPKTYTCDGRDRSPPLDWSGVPASARSLVLICDDPDAPMGTWSHWVLYNLIPSVQGLEEGLPVQEALAFIPRKEKEPTQPQARTVEGRHGKNDFGTIGYRGPCPPGGTHRYFFRLYALDTMLEFHTQATRAQVLRAIEGHILAAGRLMGKYSRSARMKLEGIVPFQDAKFCQQVGHIHTTDQD
jgi:Raf kinase inhibitor-like YbhB/YbcL family protein